MRVWSTDSVPPRQRLDYWVGAICEAFLEQHAATPSAAPFDARLEAVGLDALIVNRVTAAPQNVYRRQASIARSRANFYYLLSSNTPTWRVCQDDSEAQLSAGDIVLIDSRRCYELHFPQSYSNVAVQLPIDWLETWLPNPEGLVGRCIEGRHGWGQVLSTLLQQLQPDCIVDLTLPEKLVADQIGAFLSLALRNPASIERPQKRHDILVTKIEQKVRARSTEPGLTASAIADEIGMSVRTLHRHLALAGKSFAGIIMAERVAVADRMLTSKSYAQLSVSDIGDRLGFSDASHFARVYKRHTGVSPVQARRSP